MGLENVPCKERLGKLGLLRLKKRRFWGCLAAPFQFLRGGVLVSTEIELIFFLVAGIVLCFGFSRRIMLITHQCF